MHFRYTLAPLVLALTCFPAIAEKHYHPDHKQHTEQHSLDAHVHGLATLNIALDGQQLELQLASPAMNIVGFEYQPSSVADHHAVTEAERQLKNVQTLFTLTSAAHCSLTSMTLEHDLTAEHEHGDANEHPDDSAHPHSAQHTTEHRTQATDTHSENAHAADKHEHAHRDIQAHYIFNCSAAEKLKHIDAAGLFKAFPATETIHVQLVTPMTQYGTELSVSKTQLSW